MAKHIIHIISVVVVLGTLPAMTRATTDTFPWTELTTSGTKPSKRYAHSSFSYNGQMVIFGGIHSYYDHASSSVLTDIFDDVWTLDLTSYAWSELTTSGTKPGVRYAHSSILYNGTMVMFGGRNETYNPSTCQFVCGQKNDAWSLNLNTYDWEELTTNGTKPAKRSDHSSILYNGQMVIFGGWGPSDSHVYALYDDVWTLDLTSYAWNKVTTTLGANSIMRHSHSALLYNGLMFIFGGIAGHNGYYDTTWTLNLTSYVWNELAIAGPKPIGRFGHSSILDNGKMVIFGGKSLAGNYAYLDDAWVLSLTSNSTHYTWNELNTSGTKPGRTQHSSIYYNGAMVMFGGLWANNQGTGNDAWMFLQEPTTIVAPTTTVAPSVTTTAAPSVTTTAAPNTTTAASEDTLDTNAATMTARGHFVFMLLSILGVMCWF